MGEQYQISVIPGDGVGREVVQVGIQVAEVLSRRHGFGLDIVEYPWSCEWYTSNGKMMPDDALESLSGTDAIYMGAVGYPGVPDHVSLWGLLLPIRQAFDQYVNLRPIKSLKGIPTPLDPAKAPDLDILLVRENTEGEYVGIGGRGHQGTSSELAIQTTVFTRQGVDRIVRYAFEQARSRSGRLASATKSNAMQYTSVMWDEVVEEVAREYPDVVVTSYLIDALAARFISSPQTLDVVVASNLFGDILADIGAVLMGSMGMAASANLNPARTSPSLFEPVHGSAPDIAGKGVANPIGAVWSLAMMFDHFGEWEASQNVRDAIDLVALEGPYTADLGGKARTEEVGGAIVEAVGG